MLLLAGWNVKDPPLWAVILFGVALAGAVLVAVHHAEVIAHRVGELYGSLVLAVAVTVIEVEADPHDRARGRRAAHPRARDTVFAAVMITTNGGVGLSLLVGSLRHGIVRFNREGAGALLATLVTLSVLCFVLSLWSPAHRGRRVHDGAADLRRRRLARPLPASSCPTQTLRHRDFFLPVITDGDDPDDDTHAESPSNAATVLSVGMLLVSLVAVVGLAKLVSPSIETLRAGGRHPAGSFVGVVIALLVLLPESISAVRSASPQPTQTSLNLAYGSALASIGLTIPTIAVASLLFTGPVLLGLGGVQIVLLALTVVVSTITISTGRSTRLQGGVHLAIFAAFIFLPSVSPSAAAVTSPRGVASCRRAWCRWCARSAPARRGRPRTGP